MASTTKHSDIQTLLDRNKAWVDEQLHANPNFFKQLSKGQKPPFLFIGCSDSRKPINVLTKTGPGDMFIHRNIANQVALDDNNLQSVLAYGVGVLKVDHVIVCGHHRCGGVQAALDGFNQGIVGKWIAPIRAIHKRHEAEIAALAPEQRADRLSELNVIAQVENLCKSPALQQAFASDNFPQVHGWMFEMETGLIRQLDLPISQWKQSGILANHY